MKKLLKKVLPIMLGGVLILNLVPTAFTLFYCPMLDKIMITCCCNGANQLVENVTVIRGEGCCTMYNFEKSDVMTVIHNLNTELTNNNLSSLLFVNQVINEFSTYNNKLLNLPQKIPSPVPSYIQDCAFLV